MSFKDVALFPVSFGGALVGVLGMICAPDGITADVAGLLFLGCATLFGALIAWYPVRGTNGH
jgi:hypothetical protein